MWKKSSFSKEAAGSCFVCGKSLWQYHSRKKGYLFYTCRGCGLICIWPRPGDKELLSLYQVSQGYYNAKDIDLTETSSSEAIDISEKCRNHLPVPGRFLDVGCNDGRLLFHMQTLGWEAFGVEVNDKGVEIAKRHGLKVFHGTLDQASFGFGVFSLINIGDVLEHVLEPQKLIGRVSDLTAPGGIVRIATPNSGSGFPRLSHFIARVTWDMLPWYQSEPPYHLQQFSEETLLCFLRQYGFVPFHIEYNKSRLLRDIANSGYFTDAKRAYLEMKRGVLSPLRLAIKLLPSIMGLFIIGTVYGICKMLGQYSDRIKKSGADHMVIYSLRS